MSDNPKLKRPQDSSRIALGEKWEVDYWKKTLGVSEEKLREAVHKAGHGVQAVRDYLQHKNP